MAKFVRDSFLIQDVELQEEIGIGTYSHVFACNFKDSSGQVCKAAAKKVRTSSMEHREIETMQQLNHKNIIKFHGVYIGEMDETYILMELAERKDLRCFLTAYRIDKPSPVRLPPGLVWKWVTEASSALTYLHSLHQSHRDIKSLNYLVMVDFTLKLGDMGLTKKLLHTANTKGGGTCQWMAPEVISKQMRSPKSDVFSFGIVVWELVTTEIPFANIKGDFKIMRALCDGKRPEIPDDCPAELRHLMECSWQEDYTKRPTMEEIEAALLPCIANKPGFSPDNVNLQVKTSMGPPPGTGSMMELGTGTAIQDIHMMTQSPYASREQIDGGGDIPRTEEAPRPSPLSSHPSTSQYAPTSHLSGLAPTHQMPVQDTLAPGDSVDTGHVQQQHQYQQQQQQQQQYQQQQQQQQPAHQRQPFGFSSLQSQERRVSIEDVLNDLFLMDLAKEIGTEYLQLGIYLGFTYQSVERIKAENHSIADAIFKMLINWRQKQDRSLGTRAVVESLAVALGRAERQDLAGKIRSLSS